MAVGRWLTLLSLAVAEECNVEFLQLATSLEVDHSKRSKHLHGCGYVLGDQCDPSANFFCSNNCKVHSNGADCYRPLPDVMAEHPEEDGYCYFNFTGFWVNPLPDQNPDFLASAIKGILGLRGPDYEGLRKGPLITYHFEGEVLHTFMDSSHYSFDDLYGYALGYLQGQGLDPSMMKNSSQWIEVSKQKCLELQEKYQFQKEELVLADWLDDNQALVDQISCAANLSAEFSLPAVKARANYTNMTHCTPITARELAKHHYIKCLLGYANSASDGAYLNARACLLGGNRIGHFSECPFSPDVPF